MNINEAFVKVAIEQFIRRFNLAEKLVKVRNGNLYAGQPMYFYCNACGTRTEKLSEDFLFQPYKYCSQCVGLMNGGILERAIKENGGKTPTSP